MKYDQLVRARYEEILEQREMLARGEDPRVFIPIGLREFDKRAGLKRSQLTLFGAATGEGKSLWAKHLWEAAAKRGYRSKVYSFEDPAERTAERAMATETDINTLRMTRLDLDDKQVARMGLAVEEIGEWGELIDLDTDLRDPEDIISEIEGLSADDVDLVVVDYLQALSPEDGESLEATLRDFCWRLNRWAKNQKTAVVAMSQVNNKPEDRGYRQMERAQFRDADAPPYIGGFRPSSPSDLSWCTAAAHRAKDVGYLFRPARYHNRFANNRQDDNIMEISFPKSNFGSEGVIRVGFDLKTARFYDLPTKKEAA